MLLKCLFWNTGRNRLIAEVVALAEHTDANVIALAEHPGDGLDVLRQLDLGNLDFHLVPSIGCERIKLFTRFPIAHITHGPESNRYTIKELTIPGTEPILICLAHLPSKLHAEPVDQLHEATYFRRDIEAAEAFSNHQNTIVLGDFNMNPFDDGMVSAAALNAVPSLELAKKETRVIGGRTHKFFYNPMWNLLGDFSGAPGTYFHSSPGYLSHYWNLLDQVLIRPAIADRLDRESLCVLTQAGSSSLIAPDGRPKTSDHLPIYFSLNLH